MRKTSDEANATFPTISTPLPRGTARKDENGTYYNALGLESTEEHQHVSVIWQRQCIPMSEFAANIREQAKEKIDIFMSADELRPNSDLLLKDGTGFTLTGLKSMPRNEMSQRFIDYLAEDLAGYGNVSDADIARAKSDLAHYLNVEIDHLATERLDTIQTRIAKKQAQIDAGNLIPSRIKALQAEIDELTTRMASSKKFMARTRLNDDGDRVIRYVASERYGVIDNKDVVDILGAAIPGGWSDTLASHAFDDGDSIIGNALLPDYIKNRPDSEYGIGVSFKNSETCRYRFEICPFLFRAICLNGCIWGRSNSVISVDKKHLGKIDIEAIKEQVSKAIKIALAEGEQVLNLFDIAKEVTVGDQSRLVAGLSKEYKLTMPQGRAWLAAIADEPGNTVFHTIQGLTRAAQKFVGHARQNMEETAGLILAPSLESELDDIAKQWKDFATFSARLKDEQVESYVTVR